MENVASLRMVKCFQMSWKDEISKEMKNPPGFSLKTRNIQNPHLLLVDVNCSYKCIFLDWMSCIERNLAY